jgi:hypothetical protein
MFQTEGRFMASSSLEFFNRRGCECHACNGLKCGLAEAPTAYLIEREGHILRVCTKCLLESDQVIEILADENAPYNVYSQYDPIGTAQLVAKLMVRARSTGDFQEPLCLQL